MRISDWSSDVCASDRRIRRRGLSSAVIEGMLATSAPAFAVIDADLQHDASVLPRLFSAVAHEGNDLAVGTRYSEGGSTGAWDASREKIKIGRAAWRGRGCQSV